VLTGSLKAWVSAASGTPVVINDWASWCPSCTSEFQLLGAAASRYWGQVSFVGLDSRDDRGNAQRFLDEHPVGYASLSDPTGTQASAFGAGFALPTTMFLGRNGARRYVHIGAYRDEAQLDTDIERYAIAGR